MAFNPDSGVVVGAFDPDAGISVDLGAFQRGKTQTSKTGKTGRVDTTTYKPEAIATTEEQPERQPWTWQDVLSPLTTAAQRSGSGVAGSTLASVEDALTMPLGIVAGIGNAVGELAGSRDLRKAAEAYQEGLATRGGVAMQNVQEAGIGPGAVRGLIRGGAAPAGSPLALPALALGGVAPAAQAGMLSLLAASPVGGGILLGGTGAGLRKAEYLTGIGNDSRTIAVEDFLPVVMGAGVSGIAKAAAAGPQARDFAASLIRRAGKPTTDPEVLQAGKDFLVGQGRLPDMVRGAWLPEGVAGNFFDAMRPAVKNVGKQARLADETGAMVNMDRAVKAAKATVGRNREAYDIVLSDPEVAKSLEWMESRALVPDAAMRARLAEANIPHQGATVPLIGKEQQWTPLRRLGEPVDETVVMGSRPRTVERVPMLDEKGAQIVGKDLAPQFALKATPADPGQSIRMQGYFAEPIPKISEMSPAEILQNSPQMQRYFKDGQFPSGDKDVISGYQKLPDYLGPIPDIELPVSKGWHIQRRMQKAAWKNEPSETTPQAGRVAAGKAIDEALREQFAEVAPKLLRAKDKAAPFMAAEPYFTSLERRANTLHFTPQEVIKMAHIKGAQGAWKGSTLLDALQNAIGEKKLPNYIPTRDEKAKK